MGPRTFANLVASRVFVFTLVAAVHGGFVAWTGVVMSPDSFGYEASGAVLVTKHFDFVAWAREAPNGNPVLYTTFVTVVALAMRFAGSHWQVAVATFNVVCDAAVGLILVRLVHRLTGSRAGAWCALVLYLSAYDVMNWSHFVLTDMTNLLLTFGFFALLAGLILRESESPTAAVRAGAALVCLALVLVTRPTGLAMIPVALTAVYLVRKRNTLAEASAPLRWANALTVALLVSASVTMVAYLTVMQRPERWPFCAEAGEIRNRAREFRAGQVVSSRLETYHHAPVTALDYASILGDRFLHFFAFTARGYSNGHRVSNALFYGATYVLGSVGVAGALVAKRGVTGRGEVVVYLSLLIVLDHALFHAMTHIDFDWRYRLPIMPHLIVLASVGFAVLCALPGSARVSKSGR